VVTGSWIGYRAGTLGRVLWCCRPLRVLLGSSSSHRGLRVLHASTQPFWPVAFGSLLRGGLPYMPVWLAAMVG
jgi:hypothetical protein